MNTYAVWFKRVVWFGILANFTYAVCAFVIPYQLITFLQLGSPDSTVWLFNYSVLLVLLSCFYIPAANDPFHYLANSWLLVAARIIPATTFFISVFTAYMPTGFLTLGIGDLSIGIVEGILLTLALWKKSTIQEQGDKQLTTATLKPSDLLKMSQAEIDELYKQGSVGEIPDGDGKGIAIIAAGTILVKVLALISKLFFWQGKFFYREEKFFLNKLPPFGIRAFKGEIYKGNGRFCEGEAIILDYSQTSFIFKKVKEEMREIAPGFYLAQVYLGEKRVSNFTLEFSTSE
ncbi:MAG: hypothetical protein QNJ32_09990 [Xenococcaceae cyanobacterium MO_167.B27]|nr:hypothetical protein [Xenococcaceae cyanobacterium MO_167.B27]